MQFEYINPLAGLAMLIIGMLVMSFGYFYYGIAPTLVGAVLVVYYRRYLLALLGVY